jgi:hypothetical protein
MIKIITKRHYEEIQSSMENQKNRIRELESELDAYKRGECGECVIGKWCAACADGVRIDSLYMTRYMCLRNVPCKELRRKENE